MIQNNKLLTFLERILGPSKQYSGEEYYFKCPLCNRMDGKKKLAIKLDPSAKDKDGNSIYMHFHCWRDNSHKGTNLFQLLKKLKSNRKEYDELKSILGNKVNLSNFDDNIKTLLYSNSKIYTKVKGLPDEFFPLNEIRNNPHYKNAYNYVTKVRGLTNEDIIKYNIGYCETGKYAGYIIIPSFDENGDLNYFSSRNFYNSAMKHKNPPFKKNIVFNELYINWKEPIVLCEGVFDMMSIKRNSIPILGKYIQSNLKLKILKNSVKDIYVALDNDAIKDSINIIQDFLRNDRNVYFVEMADKDPNKIGFLKMRELIKNAKQIDFKDLIEMKLQIK